MLNVGCKTYAEWISFGPKSTSALVRSRVCGSARSRMVLGIQSIPDPQWVTWAIDSNETFANDGIIFTPRDTPTFALLHKVPPVSVAPVLVAWNQSSFRALRR